MPQHVHFLYLASFFAVMIFVTFNVKCSKFRSFNLKTAKNAEFLHFLVFDLSTMETGYKVETDD